MTDTNQTFDAAAEEAWVSEQRSTVADYLRREGIKHGAIGEWPAWYVQPYLAILAIESFDAPGRMGWWAISGDVPTDYVSFGDADHTRGVMRHFARQWAEVSSFMLRGEPHPDTTLGTPDQWPELGDLLHRREILTVLHSELIEMLKSEMAPVRRQLTQSGPPTADKKTDKAKKTSTT